MIHFSEHRLIFQHHASSIDILRESARRGSDAVNEYLTLDDKGEKLDKDEQQERVDQAVNFARNGNEAYGERFLVANATSELLAFQMEGLQEGGRRAQMEKTRKELEGLVATVDKKKEVKESGIPERIGEYFKSPKVRNALITTGVVLGTVTGTFLVYKGVRWLLGGAKKAAQETKKGISKFVKVSLGLGALAVAGVAGYFGYKTYEKYNKISGKVGEGLEFVNRKLNEVNSVLANASNLTDRKRAELVRQKEELENKKHEFEQRIIEESREKKKKEDARKREERLVPESTPESTPAGTLDVIAAGLAKHFDNDKAQSVIHSLKGRKLSEVVDCWDASKDAVIEEKLAGIYMPPSTTQDPEEQEQYLSAARRFVKFCAKSKEVSGARDMTVDKYLREFGGGYAMLSDAINAIKSGNITNWDPDASFIRQAQEGTLSNLFGNEDKLSERLKGVNEVLQKHGVTFKEIGDYLKTEEAELLSQITVNQLLSDQGNENDRVRLCISEICKNGLPEAKSLVPFFHKVLPGHKWDSDNEGNNHRVIEGYLREMHVGQALQLFTYDRMLKSKDALQQANGIALSQFEILRFIKSKDPGRFWGFIKPDFYNASLGLAEDIKDGTFDEALRKADISDEAIDKSKEIFSKHATSLLKVAGVASLGPLKGGLDSLYGTWERHPVATPLIGLPAAYALVPPFRWGVNAPVKLLKWHFVRTDPRMASDALKRTSAWNPFRATYARLRQPIAGRMPRRSAGRRLSGLVDDIDDLDAVLQRKLNRELARVLRRGGDEQKALLDFAKKVKMEIRSLPKTSSARETLESLSRKAKKFALLDEADEARRALQLYARPVRERLFGDWMKAAPWQRAAYVAGVGLQGYMLYADWQEIGDKKEQNEKAREYAESTLSKLRSQIENNPSFKKMPDGSFKHKVSGVEVSLASAQVDINNLGESLDDRVVAQRLRTATSALGLAATLWMGVKVFAGPAGLAIAGVEITIRTGISAWEQGKMREFIKDAPPWLLTYLGTEQTTDVSEYDWLTKASGLMLSDIYKNDKDKAGIRKKMLFTIFSHDLGRYAPEVLGEIFAGVSAPEVLDQFYSEDFQKIVLPAFYASLFNSLKDGNDSWEDISEGDMKSDINPALAKTLFLANPISLLVANALIPPSATLVDIRSAMRESSILYLQHIREKRYLEYRNMLAETSTSDIGDPDLEDLVSAMGDVEVFGQRLNEVSDDDLKKNNGKTRAELLVGRLITQINTAQGNSRMEKLESNSKIFEVDQSSVAGLPSSIDISKSLLPFINDSVLQEKLSNVFPETTGEKEGKIDTTWKEWLEPSGSDSGLSLHVLRMGANNVLSEVEGSVSSDASIEGAMHSMTQAGIQVMQNRGESTRFSQSEHLRDEIYGDDMARPLVFSSLRYDSFKDSKDSYKKLVSLCRSARIPNAKNNAFSIHNVRAVFFEGRVLKNGHKTVLATFVYGDIEDGVEIKVVQQTATTCAMEGSSMGKVRGMALASNASEFRNQTGAENMLDVAKKGIIEEKRQKDLARPELVRKQKEEREKILSIEQKQFDSAVEKAKKKEGVFVKVEDGEYMPTYVLWYKGKAVKHTSGLLSKNFTASVDGVDEANRIYFEGVPTKDGPYDFGVSRFDQIEKNEHRGECIDVITSPYEGQDEESVDRILHLFPYFRVGRLPFSKKPGAYYRMELLKDLLPMYEEVPVENRQMFLRELYFKLVDEKIINKISSRRIVKWFSDHRLMFGTGKRNAA
jgi:hypothetical protein